MWETRCLTPPLAFSTRPPSLGAPSPIINGSSPILDTETPYIHRLPVEIILHVFSAFLQTEGKQWNQTPPPYYYKALRLSRVCRRWRIVVYRSPRLWSEVHPSRLLGREMLDQALTNSANAPLLVRYQFPFAKAMAANAFLAKVVPHIHRWQCAQIEAPNLSSLGSAAAPILTFLKLSGDDGDPSLIVDLFQGDAPLLETLIIRNLAIRWDTPVLQRLRHLDLTLWKIEYNPPSHQQLLDIFRASPDLVKLALRFEQPIPSQNIGPNSLSPVSLPNLVDLSVSLQPPKTLANILNALLCPRCVTFWIQSEASPNSRTDPVVLDNFLSRSFTPNFSLNGSALHFKLDRNVVSVSSPERPHSIDINSFSIPALILWFGREIELWPSSPIVHLTLQPTVQMSSQEILSTLHPFKWVHSLTLYPGPASILILQHLSRDNTSSGRVDLLFPSLTELHLRYAHWGDSSAFPTGELIKFAEARMTNVDASVKLFVAKQGWGMDAHTFAEIQGVAGKDRVEWIDVDSSRVAVGKVLDDYYGGF